MPFFSFSFTYFSCYFLKTLITEYYLLILLIFNRHFQFLFLFLLFFFWDSVPSLLIIFPVPSVLALVLVDPPAH